MTDKSQMSNILIHIGLPRCASTSLQILLTEASSYPNCPIYYPTYSRDKNSSDYGHNKSICHDGIDSSGNIINAQFSGSLLREIFEVADDKPILISAEDLWRCSPANIHNDLSRQNHFSSVKIVYATRPYSDWIFSIYRHNQNRINEPFSAFAALALEEIVKFRKNRQRSIYDLARISDWREFFSSLHRISYPSGRSPLSEIATIAELPKIPAEWNDFSIHTNESITMPASLRANSSLDIHEISSNLASCCLELGLDIESHETEHEMLASFAKKIKLYG